MQLSCQARLQNEHRTSWPPAEQASQALLLLLAHSFRSPLAKSASTDRGSPWLTAATNPAADPPLLLRAGLLLGAPLLALAEVAAAPAFPRWPCGLPCAALPQSGAGLRLGP